MYGVNTPCEHTFEVRSDEKNWCCNDRLSPRALSEARPGVGGYERGAFRWDFRAAAQVTRICLPMISSVFLVLTERNGL